MNKKILKEHFDSTNLFEKISLLSENQVVEIYNGIEWTTKNYSNAVIIGGTAVVYYLNKGRDLTPDVDFLVEDVSELKSKLDNDNMHYDLIKGDKGNIGITVEDFNIDYLDVNAGNVVINKLILRTYKNAKIAGYTVKIIIPELLAIMKIEFGRDKDFEDGLSLIKSKILNKEIYLKLVNGLKNHLSEYKSLLSYMDIL